MPSKRPLAASAIQLAEGVAAVLRAMELLDAFQLGESQLALSELSRRVSLHKTTVLRLARTLAQAGYLVRCDGGAWRLGPAAGWLGARYQAGFDVQNVLEPALRELSQRTGVKVPTIRYYEQIGLLSPPPRSDGGQRRYGSPEVGRLNFIRHARELGFEIDDIRELLAMSAEPQASCHQADSIARNHLLEVDRRIAGLQALRGELARMIDECGHGRVCDCRIIEALADHSHCTTEHRH